MCTGADDKLGAGFDGGFSLSGGGDGAGAEQQAGAVLALEFFQKIDCAGDGHGDFNDGNAAGDHGFDEGVGLGGVAGAENGNKADAFEGFCCGFVHCFLYRAMRAEPPLMMRSTSASVAMLVSPGVVMARAPWATPQRTAQSMGLAASRP